MHTKFSCSHHTFTYLCCITDSFTATRLKNQRKGITWQELVLKKCEQAPFWNACVSQRHNNYVFFLPELLLRDSLVHESHLNNTCLCISVIELCTPQLTSYCVSVSLDCSHHVSICVCGLIQLCISLSASAYVCGLIQLYTLLLASVCVFGLIQLYTPC